MFKDFFVEDSPVLEVYINTNKSVKKLSKMKPNNSDIFLVLWEHKQKRLTTYTELMGRISVIRG